MRFFRPSFRPFVLVVRAYYAADQFVTHHVAAFQPDHRHALDPFQHLFGVSESAHDVPGQVYLRVVAGHHHLAALTKPGEEHLHLLLGGVLRFVQYDETFVERPAAHIRERRYLHKTALHVLGVALAAAHELFQRVVQRTEVRVHLFGEVAREETQLLACLHRRAREDYLLHGVALQRIHGESYGKIGLARAGRAYAEGHVIVADGVAVHLLPHAFGVHRLASPHRDGSHKVLDVARFALAHHVHHRRYLLRTERLLRGKRDQRVDGFRRTLDIPFLARYLQRFRPREHAHAELLFQ